MSQNIKWTIVTVVCTLVLTGNLYGTSLLDEFNRADNGDLGANWTELDGGSWAISGNELVADASGQNFVVCTAPGTELTGPFQCTVKCKSSTNNPWVGLVWNVQDLYGFSPAYNYYHLKFYPGLTWSETNFSGCVTRGAIVMDISDASGSITFAFDTYYTLSVTNDGTPGVFQVSITDGTDTFSATATDPQGAGIYPAYLAGGYAGVAVQGNPDATFDDFYLNVDAAPETATITLGDEFDRADSSDPGADWQEHVGQIDIAGQTAVCATPNILAEFSPTGAVLTEEYSTSVQIKASTNIPYVGIAFNIQDNQEYYYLRSYVGKTWAGNTGPGPVTRIVPGLDPLSYPIMRIENGTGSITMQADTWYTFAVSTTGMPGAFNVSITDGVDTWSARAVDDSGRSPIVLSGGYAGIATTAPTSANPDGSFDNMQVQLVVSPNCQSVIDQGLGFAADINGDCVVDMLDYSVLANEWMLCNDISAPDFGTVGADCQPSW